MSCNTVKCANCSTRLKACSTINGLCSPCYAASIKAK